MNQERKDRLQSIRLKLANLSESEKAALISRGLIATVEGRILSHHNTLMVYLQSNGNNPTVVGGFHQWRKAGRQVKRGEHGFMILFPIGDKDKETGELLESPTHYYTGTVFDKSQTNLIGEPEPELTPKQDPEPVYTQPHDKIMEGWALVK